MSEILVKGQKMCDPVKPGHYLTARMAIIGLRFNCTIVLKRILQRGASRCSQMMLLYDARNYTLSFAITLQSSLP